jgi:acetolactate synthase-1/2/3 large subunit
MPSRSSSSARTRWSPFAGTVPATQEGELPGGRTEFVQWIQDVRDQRGIIRNYVKYDQEIRSGRNVKQLLHRALQVARSEPAGRCT